MKIISTVFVISDSCKLFILETGLEFAKGKPITLLSGSNLLHLLEKHGHKAKIDLVEAKKSFIVNKKGMILHKTKHKNEKKHDYNMFKKTGPPPIPPDVEIGVDPGYQGIEKDYSDLKVKIPVKKKKKQDLSKKDKRYNKKLSQERVIVEHTIGKMKKFGIMRETFRNRLTRYGNMVSIVSGLVSFQLMSQ